MVMQTLFSWQKRRTGSRRVGTKRRPTRRCSLALEILEDRTAPAVLIVNTLADNVTDDSVLTLREAIALVNHGGNAQDALGRALSTGELAQISGDFGDNDTIRFASTLSGQTIQLTEGQLTLSSDMTIMGLGADQLTIEQTTEESRVFDVTSGTTVEFAGLTITGGSTPTSGPLGRQNGGGIRNLGGIVDITNSTISGNEANSSGGGIYNLNGIVTVTNSTISGNSANVHGGGGGIYNSGGPLTVTNSTISGNFANLFGGGISNFGAVTTVTNSTISGNSTNLHGGGIDNSNSSTLTVTNSTITGNRANANGRTGSIATFDGNGGGIVITRDDAQTLLNNTIVAGNVKGLVGSETDSDIETLRFFTRNVDAASAHNLIGDPNTAGGLSDGVNNNIIGNGGSGTININTILDTTLANNGGPTLTHALVAGSPALNAGDNSLIPASVTTDQRGTGFPRIIDGTVDIGAFEADLIVPVIDWSNPAPIVYGTALSGTQLNAVARDPDTSAPLTGTFSYNVSEGAVLDASNHTLTVTFMPDQNTIYNLAGASVSLTMDRADLTVTADDAQREYGDPNPTLSGTIVGITNNDNITAGYTTEADESGSVGDYDIVPAINDPDNRLSNYNVTITNGTLTVTPATLTVNVDDATWQIGTPFPTFTGTLSGAQNNESFTVVYSSAADETSTAGQYAITAEVSGATLSNYNVVINAGTLTVTAAQVRMEIQMGSLNLASNGAFSLVIFGASSFDVSQVSLNGLAFAGVNLTPFNQSFQDVDGDGHQDLVLHFRMTNELRDALTAIYAGLLETHYSGGNTFKQSSLLALDGVFGEHDQEFTGADSVDLFLSGKSLRDLLNSFGNS